MFNIGDIEFNLVRVKQDSKQPLYNQSETSIDNSYPNMSLILPKNIVVVDADDKIVADVLFKMYKDYTHWVKTDRGYHFYFKVNTNSVYFPSNFSANKFSSKRYCLLGFKVDYKKNLPNFNDGVEHLEVVKVKSNGKIREFKNNFIAELPLCLYPLYKDVEINKVDLFNIIGLDTDRNSTLMSVIGSLIQYTKYYNYNYELIEDTIRNINNYVFREPLDNKELDSLVSRITKYGNSNNNINNNEFTINTYTQNTKYNTDLDNTNGATGDILAITTDSGIKIDAKSNFINAIVNYLTKNYILVRYAGKLYIKDTNVSNVKFEECSDPVNMGVFLESLGVYIINKNFVNDIIFKCEVKAQEIASENMSVIFKNGYVLEQETGNVRRYNNEFSNIIIDTEYHPPKKLNELSKEELYYRDMVDNFISFVADGGINESFYIRDVNNPEIHDGGETARREVENVLEQILGHMFMTNRLPQYAYFFTGTSGANGKSTLFNVMKALIGDKNSTAVSLEQLNENYYLSTMIKSLVNIGDDIDDSFIESSRAFKTIVTNNPIVVREIQESPIEVKIFSTLLYNCNKMPRFKDISGGIERRLKIIPMLKKVPEHKRRNDLEIILTHPLAKQRLLERALIGFKRLRQTRGIIKFGRVIDMESEKYFLSIDSFRGFLYDELIKDDSIVNLNIDYKDKIYKVANKWINRNLSDIYSQYLTFCSNDGRKYPITKNSFKQRVESDFNFVSKYNSVDWEFTNGIDTIYNL